MSEHPENFDNDTADNPECAVSTQETGARWAERGANLVEYVLLLALIVLVCIAAIGLLGDKAQLPYSEISSGLGS